MDGCRIEFILEKEFQQLGSASLKKCELDCSNFHSDPLMKSLK